MSPETAGTAQGGAHVELPDVELPHVELRGVSKHFGGARALESVSVRIGTGSVHALVGENGAGKSTLGKIISGVIAPDQGEMLVRGVPVHFRSPREALGHGVATIAQELAIVPELSAAANVFLGVEPRRSGCVQRRELRRRYTSLCRSVGLSVPADSTAGRLRTADQQKLEILRAVARDAELIVMDEPSAALTRDEARHLHDAIRSLRERGRTIVLVSHFLGEVLELADSVTVLRDGSVVRSGPCSAETERSLIEAMLGRSLDKTFPAKQKPSPGAPVVLSVRDLSAAGFRGVSLDVRAGEIVGLAGLVGAGRTELAQAIVGWHRSHGLRFVGRSRGSRRGTVEVAGMPLTRRNPRVMLDNGVAMIPESRKEHGLLLGRSVVENTVLSSLGTLDVLGYVRRKTEDRAAGDALRRVGVRGAAPGTQAGALSGGNQQKLLFARSLLARPRVLIADEPTRGVDVGARRAIYDLLVNLAREGLGVLLISSDNEEILGLSHRILVMRAGEVVTELDGEGATDQEVLEAAFRERTRTTGVAP
jgi:simple sugar transport system ATP-binding protein/ribose transport system ATP-binding protein